ncbi:hypothetical protein [Streptomyces sp. Ag109_O5-10]|uniref:hypothetical protein n=1 Tax=Streptomyces sp. Ag109_O5-10 TaxID=1855349 RepID=UPI000899F40D|nr:hypothetical protein SAMN05216533_5728 [Streptomyces sp. Ag109_O5-10]
MLRKLNVEFRGNGLLDELYSKLVRNGAVMHMKNSCSPTAADVKISTPARAVEAAGRIGAEMAERITATGVRAVGDPALLSALPAIPAQPGPPAAEARIPPEVAARPSTARAAAASAPVRHAAAAKSRTVHQTSSKELVRVLGHRCMKKLRRR